MHANKFRVIFNRDAGTTGNLEVHVFKTENPSAKKLVHTKRGSQGYPANNWEQFHNRLDNAIKEL